MNLKDIKRVLENTRIESLETIAKKTRCRRPEEYLQNFALEVVTQRVICSGMDYLENTDEFPYLLTDHIVLIGFSYESIVKDMKKQALKDYNRKLQIVLESYNGIIHFLPFQYNDKISRRLVQDNLNIDFINIHYDRKSMGRRFKEYCS